MDIFSWDSFGSDASIEDSQVPGFTGDVVYDFTELQGDGNSAPVVSDVTPQTTPTLQQLLGSGGIVQTARDLGTAVGTIQQQINAAGPAYTQARTNAATGNKLGTWWQYASTTDKLMVGLAVIGIIVALKD